MAALMSADRIEATFVDDEHRRLRVGLAILQEAIADGHRWTRDDAIDRVARVLAWLRRDFLPHTTWEEARIYPALDQQARSPWATRALRFEHQQIRELAGLVELEYDELLEHWNSKVAHGLLAALARLDAVITSHLAQEERFVTPLI